MIRLLRSEPPAERHEFVFDIEARKWWQFRVGVVQEIAPNAAPVKCWTMADLFAALCSLPHRSRAWAHYGGRYDFRFVIEQARREGVPIGAIKEQLGGVWTCSIVLPDRRIDLVDTAMLLRGSLQKLAQYLGTSKAETDYKEVDKWSDEKCAEQCIVDCRILAAALTEFKRALKKAAAEFRETPAGVASATIRRTLETAPNLPEEVDNLAKEAFCGGRVEIFQKMARGNIRYYDIKSSYPYAAISPLPWDFIHAGKPRKGILSPTSVVLARVSVPEMAIPPLPYRHKQRLFFPWGEWKGWFVLPEIRELENLGGRSEILQVLEFSSRAWLAPFMEKWYAARCAAKDPFEAEVYKMLLNHGLGKLAETSERQSVRLLARGESPVAEIDTPIGDGSYLAARTNRTYPPFRHAAAGAFVTAIARINIGRLLRAFRAPFYCDTDSVFAAENLPNTGLPRSGLGSVSVKERWRYLLFLGAKFRGGERANGTWGTSAKGFREMSRAEFEACAEGAKIAIERTAGLRERAQGIGDGDGELGIARIIVEKALNLKTQPKRAPTANGRTRAWHVSELE